MIPIFSHQVAEAVSKTSAAPLERTKLILQNQDELIRQGRINRPFTGLLDCLARLYRVEGLASFWRGNGANCLRACPAQALNFSFKSIYAPLFPTPKDPNSLDAFASNVATGSLAGASSLVFVYSLDLARTRLANDAKNPETGERQFRNLRDVYRQVHAVDGFKGLYCGFGPGLLGIVVYRGLYFGLYDSLKPILLTGSLASNTLAMFGVAYFSTTVAELTAYPLDSIKRHMMLTAGEKKKYKGMMDAASHMIRRNGYASLFRGSWTNILRGVAGSGTLTLYDKMSSALTKRGVDV